MAWQEQPSGGIYCTLHGWINSICQRGLLHSEKNHAEPSNGHSAANTEHPQTHIRSAEKVEVCLHHTGFLRITHEVPELTRTQIKIVNRSAMQKQFSNIHMFKNDLLISGIFLLLFIALPYILA